MNEGLLSNVESAQDSNLHFPTSRRGPNQLDEQTTSILIHYHMHGSTVGYMHFRFVVENRITHPILNIIRRFYFDISNIYAHYLYSTPYMYWSMNHSLDILYPQQDSNLRFQLQLQLPV